MFFIFLCGVYENNITNGRVVSILPGRSTGNVLKSTLARRPKKVTKVKILTRWSSALDLTECKWVDKNAIEDYTHN
jgi:hypothetical protein